MPDACHHRKSGKLSAAIAATLAVLALAAALAAGVRFWPAEPAGAASVPAATDMSPVSRAPVFGLPALLTVE